MKVTEKIVTPIPPPKTFIVEMTEDEMFRLCALSMVGESGDEWCPYPFGERLCEYVPKYIKEAYWTYKQGPKGARNPFAPPST